MLLHEICDNMLDREICAKKKFGIHIVSKPVKNLIETISACRTDIYA